MRSQSWVMSSFSCGLRLASFGFIAMPSSTHFCSAFIAFRLTMRRSAEVSPAFIWPVLRDGSCAPPLTTCDESPAPLPPPSSATRSGELK